MDVELEHGSHDPATNGTGDLNEFPDCYTRLKQTEDEAERDHGFQ